MSHNIAKSAIWVTLSEIIFNLSGFIIHSILGRVLGPADYGRYGIIVTLTTMVIILIGNGIPTAMAKYISEIFETNPRLILKIKKQAILIQTILIAFITGVFFICAPLISRLLGDPTLTPLFRFSSLIIPAFAAASFYFSYYTGLHRFGTQATLKTVRSFLRIIFVVGMAVLFGLYGSISGYIIAPFIVFVIAYFIDKLVVDKKIKEKISQMPQDKTLEVDFNWKKLVNYGWQIVAFFLAYELLISIDLYMVKGILHDDALTGIYNASLTVGRIPYYIFYAMTIFLLPMVSRKSADNNLKNAQGIINDALRIMLIFLVPMIFLMSVYSTQILQILYGKRYLAGSLPMSILVFGVGFLTIFYVLSFAANGAGKTITTMYISLAGLVMNIILNYIFILKIGILGSAWATTITSFFIMLAILYYVKKHFGSCIDLVELAKVSLSGLILYFLAFLIPTGKFSFIPLGIAIFLIYLTILYILKGITKEDLSIFTKILKKK
ncbi:MAG: flippase [Parcubacteria group bacterium]|jgi:stage V sporulation protein B